MRPPASSRLEAAARLAAVELVALRARAVGERSQPADPSRDDSGETDAPIEAVARAVLGTLAEPGDGALGRLVGALGAVECTELLIADATPAALVGRAADAGTVIDAAEVARGIERWRPRLDHASFMRALGQAVRVGATLLVPGDPGWPCSVDELGAHAPLALWVRGAADALVGGGERGDRAVAAPYAGSIALVGARAATGYGEHITMESAAGLADRGLTVVSGGAYGIDGVAHRASLAAGGITIAFLAGGVDRFYPAGHDQLLGTVAQHGAVVSELPCGSAPTKWRFLQRNRLIAASAHATVVLEAGIRSGSLNTAGHAAALGRPLGAVPGPVTSAASAGCHRLLREYDATCVTGAADMAELVSYDVEALDGLRIDSGGDGAGHEARRSESHRPGARTAEQIRTLDALSTRSARDLDEVARRAGLPVRAVMSALGVLDLDGSVDEHDGLWVRRRSGGSPR